MSTPSCVVAAILTSGLIVGCGSSKPAPEKSAPDKMPSTTFPATLPMPTGMAPLVTSLKFSPGSIDAIMAGTKTSTTRKYKPIATGSMTASDGKRTIVLTVTSVTPKPFSQLTEDDAKTDGSLTLSALQDHLKRDYPGIKADDQLIVVRFIAPPK